MATVTTYTCDKCKDGSTAKDFLWTVNINVYPQNHQTRFAYQKGKLAQEWCRPCVEKAHLLPPKAVKKENLPEPPTFESFAADFVNDIVEEALDARI